MASDADKYAGLAIGAAALGTVGYLWSKRDGQKQEQPPATPEVEEQPAGGTSNPALDASKPMPEPSLLEKLRKAGPSMGTIESHSAPGEVKKRAGSRVEIAPSRAGRGAEIQWVATMEDDTAEDNPRSVIFDMHEALSGEFRISVGWRTGICHDLPLIGAPDVPWYLDVSRDGRSWENVGKITVDAEADQSSEPLAQSVGVPSREYSLTGKTHQGTARYIRLRTTKKGGRYAVEGCDNILNWGGRVIYTPRGA